MCLGPGELLQTSDGVVSRISSGGQKEQLMVFQSSMPAISSFTVSYLSAHGPTLVSQLQNNSAFDNQYVTYTASMGDWSDSKYDSLVHATSTWTQIFVLPRSVYFASLDKNLSRSFATILFGTALVLYLKSTFTSDSHNHEGGPAIHETQTDERIDDALCDRDPLCMTDQDSLCSFVQNKLEPLVQQLRSTCDTEPGLDCDVSLRRALVQKAVFYIEQANAGNQVFPLMMLEGKFGQQSTQVKLFKNFCGKTATPFYFLTTFAFLMTIFISDDTIRLVADVFLLTLISCFVALGAWAEYHSLEGSLRPRSKWAVATTAALWVLMAILVPLGVAPEVDAIFRVSMIFFASESLSAALGVVSFCMWEVTTMIALYCTVLVLTANLVMVMYYHELSENYGDTVSTFFDAFIAMYVFLESAGAFAFNICVLICVLCR